MHFQRWFAPHESFSRLVKRRFELYRPRARLTQTRSASEVGNSFPRLRFGFVWNVPSSTACGILISVWMLSMLVLAGCRLGANRVVTCPLPYEEQKTTLLEIAPVGTPRDEAVKRLEEAGIRGSFGIRNSVYYCDSWEQDMGQHWHLDLALLFDESGRLYEIRPTQFLADSSPAAVSTSAGITGDSEKPDGIQGTQQSGGNSPKAASASAAGPSPPASSNPARSGPRTPFAQETALPMM